MRSPSAACFWWPAHDSSQPITAKALAGNALRNTKSTWTASRRQALANLIGLPFDQAVEETDTKLRIRGPLQWRVGTVIADAAACFPWLGLPARGLRVLGMINCDADGIVQGAAAGLAGVVARGGAGTGSCLGAARAGGGDGAAGRVSLCR
ncbi:hypothetical protein [Streptomyces sp. NPDC059753]|uniref:hypothetical protein n=1 Tax=Streptomyces sp. NPDC059753 TaxID=3346933 RepID=UPI00364F34E5